MKYERQWERDRLSPNKEDALIRIGIGIRMNKHTQIRTHTDTHTHTHTRTKTDTLTRTHHHQTGSKRDRERREMGHMKKFEAKIRLTKKSIALDQISAVA